MAKKVLIVAGTRPEVIKMAPVYLAMRQDPYYFPVFVSTGQHRQMLDETCTVFGFVPDIDFGLMQSGQNLADLTAKVITSMSRTLSDQKPEIILAQGDTTTVLGTAMAAFYARIPLGHVEAGLRTYNYQAPWPEEMNRRLTAPLARWCFAPTETSRQNLLSERIPPENIFITGNTVIDALLYVRQELKNSCDPLSYLTDHCGLSKEFASKFLAPAGSGGNRFILVTAHRRESFGEGFVNICRAFKMLSTAYPSVGIVYPVHLNPSVQEPVRRLLGDQPGIQLIRPTNYQAFVWLMDRCAFLLSDSGGVQEEAPSLGKPVLIMRETTERPEGVAAGTCRLTGTSPDRILQEARFLLEDSEEYMRRSQLKNPYGNGDAADKIIKILKGGSN